MTDFGILTAAALVPLAIGAAVHATPPADPDPGQARLVGWSALPTETYVPDSARSGHWTTGNAAVPAPYPGQPVQGFSATHALADGDYLVMSDNGFGAKANSADFELAVHRIRPNPETGRTAYEGLEFNLSDPDRHIPWTIWRDGACTSASSLPSGYACPTPDRILTGWDFDPESMQVAKDGTFWFGEEFGPYLLHTNDRGELLEAPIPTPGVRSPSNPTLGGATANLANSKGYEGMAIAPNGRVLHPMLEGAVAEDRAAGLGADLRIYTVTNGAFADGFLRYRMESTAHALGDFIMVNGRQGLVIERDNLQGPAAAFKRIYLVDLTDEDGDGYVEKTLLVDLMDVRDPDRLGGLGETFTFPYFTIEDVEIIDARTIAVMNDNNFPATGGRGTDVPDVNEYLEIRLDQPLKVHPRLLPGGYTTTPAPAATGQEKPSATSFAVIGDVPYGAAQVAAFPGWVDRINAEPGLDLAFHVGDIKNGSSPCTDAYNAMIRAQLDRFEMPLLYTPGDNEWTDCHRPAAGSYHPLERLSALRATFFQTPGTTLGARPRKVATQADLGFPENQRLRTSGIEMATIHVVGSNNDRAPWTGLGLTTPTAEQLAEESDRMAAAIQQVEETFDRARRTQARAVAIFQQADMFDPSYQPTWDLSAFQSLVQTLVDEASDFDGEVYLFDGDSHVYNVDRPLASGSRWLQIHGVRGSADNLTRITVDGEANNTGFLEVTVNRPGSERVLSWGRVPYASAP